LEGSLKPEELTTAELDTFERIKPLWHQAVEMMGMSDARLLLVEERLWMHDEKMNPLFSGRLDLALAKPGAVAIMEYKTLEAPDPAHLNWQLRAQAVLLAENYPDFIQDNSTAWHLCILQPNASPKISHAVFSNVDVARWRETILGALSASTNPEVPAFPGRWCTYCRAKKHCREYGAYAAIALADTCIPDLINITKAQAEFEQKAIETWKSMTPEQRLARYLIVRLAAALEDEMKAIMERELEKDPDAYGGAVYLKPGAVLRKVKDVKTALALLEAKGITVDDLVEKGALQLSVGKAEVCFANARQKERNEKITSGCPERYRLEFNETLADVIETETKSPTLAIRLPAKITQK
jgi:hypothetical protein